MQYGHQAVRAFDQDIFGPSGQPFHAVASQPRAEIRGHRQPEFGRAGGGAGDHGAFKHEHKATAHGFNFGQLGHIVAIFLNGKRMLVFFGRAGLWSAKISTSYQTLSNRADAMMSSSKEDHTAQSPAQDAGSTTHFGFKTVNESEKASMVRGVFNSVADRYDVMNDVMSAGVHRLWKSSLINSLNPRPGMHLLDVAGGTGDIAFRFLDASAGGQVTVCDINAEMLRVGKGRAADKGYADRAEFVCGDAQKLPFEDRSKDAYTIAFGIRNVTRIEEALAEAYRVLKPGGRFFCLEFSPQVVPVLQKAYDSYSFGVIPKMGGMITGDADSYQYLVESIRRFPVPDRFADMISTAGFDRVGYRTMSAGVVALHYGTRI